MFEKFTGLYKVSKTLRFELKPIGKTMENIEKFKVLENDFVRDAQYSRMKDILDLQHRALLERSLERVGKEEVVEDWVALAEAYRLFRGGRKDKTARATLDKVLERMRRSITSSFAEDEMFKELTESTPSKFIKRMVKSEGLASPDDQVALDAFDSFACYFTGYQENRKNIYSDKPQTTAAAYRAIDVNFPKFLEAVDVVKHIQATYPKIVADAEVELGEKLGGKRIAEMFNIERYGDYLPQSGIDFYNLVLGGYAPIVGEKKRGLNEFINLERQQNADAAADLKFHKIAPLYKQILSEREGESFRFSAFEHDADVILAVKDFAKRLEDDLVAGRLKTKLSTIVKSEKIFVCGGTMLSTISKNLCGSWGALEACMQDAAEARFKVLGNEKKVKKAVDEWMKSKSFPLADLPDVTIRDDENSDSGTKTYRLLDCWRGEYAQKLFDSLKTTQSELLGMSDDLDKNTTLKEDEGRVAVIKNYLDAVQDVLHLVKPMAVSAELDRDMDFYSEFDELYERLDEVVPLYNKVRNYVTKKVGEVEKMKLMFDCATLGDGWDLNKESANRCVIFIRDGRYYLGVMRPKCKIDFSSMSSDSGNAYRKMVYKYLPGPNKMLPKVVLLSEKGKSKYKPGRSILDGYEKKCHIKSSPNFDLDFCHELIDFFKASIAKNDDWSVFDFKFSPTNNYTSIDGFYKEVTEQGYKLDFVNVSASGVDALVERGELLLFQIYNKDFAEGSKGRPNLHTLYWNAVFCAENLARPVVQLCGGAELFRRPVAIKKPYAHEVGEKMLNRWTKDGDPIPEVVFGQLFRFVNGKVQESELGSDAKALLAGNRLVIKPVTHRIVKDARYTRDGFFLHVPIALNAFAGDAYGLNEQVNVAVSGNKDVNIIGLDRGERHLIYLTLINLKGEILLQKSFNTITGASYDGLVREVNYQKKLTVMEKGRDAARKSWTEIGKIKDLKSGYISLVVHEIVSLMLKYNAIVVLEDLNFGFKRGRFKVERQVYQKFERALIEKLNYLVFKGESVASDGGALKGYQLTDKFESFEKLGKQTGFVYYVPAGYTSKIDPTTGFTNLFNTKKCTNAANIAEFFSKFDSIVWDEGRKCFAFTFDYSNFKVSQTSWKKSWTVYSAARRLVFDKEIRGEKEISPTQIILDALKKAGKIVSDGFDLRSCLMGVEPNKANATLFRDVFFAFDRTLQMRNSCAATGEDYISSPVMNSEGKFFDSRESGDSLPKNADANGAYHIALKGLYLVKNRLGKEKDLKIAHEQWFEFVQNR